MTHGKTDHSIASREKVFRETEELLAEMRAKHGHPRPLTPEEQDRLETELHNHHRKDRKSVV